MLLAGDERGHTQKGNNNVYCQDNELGWLDWSMAPEAASLRDFVAELIRVRRLHPSFRRRSFFRGQPAGDGESKDVVWLRPDGQEMTSGDWGEHVRCLGMLFSGQGITDVGPRGEAQQDDDFLLLLNAHHEPVDFTVPAGRGQWEVVLTTDDPDPIPLLGAGDTVSVLDRSLLLLRNG